MDRDGLRYPGEHDAVAGQPIPPRPRGRRPAHAAPSGAAFRVALVAAIAVLLLAPPAAVAYATAREGRAVTLTGQGLAGAPGRDVAGRPDAAAGAGRQPGPGATRGPAPTTAEGKIQLALQDQSAALLTGDEDAFLSVVDPSAAGLREDLARRFGSLRQLQVKLWQAVLSGKPRTAGGTATATVYVKYCFVVTTCDPMDFETTTKWNVAGQSVTLLEFGTADQLGPRPWEAAELHAVVGNRVVMAASAKYAARLPAMLAAAERAAALTDTFARWGEPPARYVVYLAGPDEWSSWYGIHQQPWVAGFALPLTASATEIVLNASRVDARQTVDVLRHEFTHVVTLAGVERAYPHTWWLVEGIAEYVRVKGGGKSFDGLGEVRTYVRSGHWNGEIAMDDPPDGSTTADVSGRYGVAYLSLQHIADRFGEERLLSFFDYAARQGLPLSDAAPKALGVSWDDLEADCAKAVRGRI
ncbi:basic secretory protein-like protein [Dactylosporangium sp. CA-092794]|uniref:basic secretory protein-like protein n=1 Tax=Dactylosporangium sp. CA-092794 TaxID=3239929 RepID=UPI003D931540